jgi:hypothetical protein
MAVSRKLRISLWILGGLAALIAVVLLALYLAARHEPEFYRAAMEIEPALLETASDQMLQQTTALASSVKKPGKWESLFTARQINGWLAIDMVNNHPTTLPPMMRDPRVEIDSDEVTVACRFEQGGVVSILSLTVQPYVPEPNVIALRIIRARAGLLPLPLKKVTESFAKAARDLQLHLEWKQSGGDPVAFLSLPSDADDDRQISLDTLRLGAGEIYLSGTTKRKP